MNLKEIPETIEMEKQLFSDMFMKERLVVPDVAAIIDSDDLYRVEHRLVFQAILRLYVKGETIDYLAVEEELRKSGDFGKIDHRYFLFLIDATFPLLVLSITLISLKKKPTCASLSNLATCSKTEAEHGEKSFNEIISYTESHLSSWCRSALPSKSSQLADYFANHLKADINSLKNYANRLTGFNNLDQKQFFSPGLYVIGATPAAGKTTFCWQLLEELAQNGESAKTAAQRLFLRDKQTTLTAADIRHGSWSAQFDCVINEVANSQANFQVTKLGVDDSVRKLKKFRRDTNSTFIVISSFN